MSEIFRQPEAVGKRIVNHSMRNDLISFYLHKLYNGGIERVIFNLATELLGRGFRVDLVVNDAGWSSMQKQIPSRLRLVDLQAKFIIDRPFKLRDYLERESPMVVLASQHFSNEISVLASAMACVETRVIVWEHTTFSVELESLARLSPRRLLLTSRPCKTSAACMNARF